MNRGEPNAKELYQSICSIVFLEWEDEYPKTKEEVQEIIKKGAKRVIEMQKYAEGF